MFFYFTDSFISSKAITLIKNGDLLKNFPDVKNVIKRANHLLPKSYENINRRLDNLSMIRKTYFNSTIPDTYYKDTSINFKNRKTNSKVNFENGIPNKFRNLNNAYEYHDYNNNHNFKNRTVPSDISYNDNVKSIPKINLNNYMETIDNVNLFKPKESKLLKLLNKQNELVLKLAENLDLENVLRKRNNDFDDLLNEIENRKNITVLYTDQDRFTDSTPATQTTKRAELSTVITLIDETEIKNALRNDPLVKRILGVAHKRREDYVKQAKKFFNIE